MYWYDHINVLSIIILCVLCLNFPKSKKYCIVSVAKRKEEISLMIATVVNWDKNYIECDGTKRVMFW